MSTQTLNPSNAIDAMLETAPAKTEVRKIPDGAFQISDHVRQGDIYITRIHPTKNSTFETGQDKVTVSPKDYITKAKEVDGVVQLVPGMSTGSRHIVRPNAKVRVMLNPKNNNALIGPIIEAETRFCVEHPKHAHMDLPAGTYQVTYQLNAATQQRVRD
jgi:hypothetical protein